ncbi:MAG: hypothetical protein RL337_905 [Bacteroidota bacterium]
MKGEDSVAQLVEQYTFNVWVLGSSPSGITKPQRKLGFFYAENVNQACFRKRMMHKKTNATKGCVKRLCASLMRKGRRRSATVPTIPGLNSKSFKK